MHRPTFSFAPALPARARCAPSRHTPRAEYITTKGLEVDFGAPSASGNFGRVYFGRYTAPIDMDVVVKCPLSGELARELYNMELYTNRKLARGHSEHSRYARYLGQIALPGGITDGGAAVGLVWQREGAGDTLERYLSSARVGQLATALGVDAMARPLRRTLAKAVLRELLTCLRQLQDADIVHRDLKPANVLVVPGATAPLKAIDFGSACEWAVLWKRGLRNATCDPVYAPPERRLTLMRPADRFDVYSAALIALRVALPSLTDEKRMQEFVEKVLTRARSCLLRAVVLVLGGNIQVDADIKSDIAALEAPKNEDLLSALASMLTERPEDRADVGSALSCRFLAEE